MCQSSLQKQDVYWQLGDARAVVTPRHQNNSKIANLYCLSYLTRYQRADKLLWGVRHKHKHTVPGQTASINEGDIIALLIPRLWEPMG